MIRKGQFVMLVMTARVSKKRIAGICIVLAVVICAACFWQNESESTAVFESNGVKVETGKMSEAEARVSFLKQLGWEVEPEPVEFMEVQIPQEFDEVYTKYNEIQLEQGMDLTKYQGKRVMRYTYAIKNYPSGETGICANILIYKNKLIGGDVCSSKLDGFMHGLSMPKSQTEQ